MIWEDIQGILEYIGRYGRYTGRYWDDCGDIGMYGHFSRMYWEIVGRILPQEELVVQILGSGLFFVYIQLLQNEKTKLGFEKKLIF